MADMNDPVALDSFPNPFVADLVVQILKSAGIPSYVEGGSLADEYAASQRLLGGMGSIVYVRREDVAAARAAIAEAREAGKVMDGGEG